MYKSYKSAVKAAHKAKTDINSRIFPYRPATKERKREKRNESINKTKKQRSK